MADSAHVITAGCRRLVSLLAKRLDELGNGVAVVDAKEKALDNLSPSVGGTRIVEDAVEAGVPKCAGIDKAGHLFATSQDDNTTLKVAQVAKKVSGVPHVTARVYDPGRHELYRALDTPTICPTEVSARVFLDALVNDPENEPISRALMVEQCFSATRTIAALIEEHATLRQTLLAPLAIDGVNVIDTTLPKDASAIGETLRALAMPDRPLGACIIRDGQVIGSDGGSRLQADDLLIDITDPADHIEVVVGLTRLFSDLPVLVASRVPSNTECSTAVARDGVASGVAEQVAPVTAGSAMGDAGAVRQRSSKR